jgi:hypothetical protein
MCLNKAKLNAHIDRCDEHLERLDAQIENLTPKYRPSILPRAAAPLLAVLALIAGKLHGGH